MQAKKTKEVVLKAVERIARVEVLSNSKQWPPVCMGILYQPKRPKRAEM